MLVIVTNRIIPKRFHAYNIGPITFVRPEHADNEALLAHERVHFRQWCRNPFMYVFYHLSKKARYAYELEAYREQLTFVRPSAKQQYAERYAGFIIENYAVDKSNQAVIEDLLRN